MRVKTKHKEETFVTTIDEEKGMFSPEYGGRNRGIEASKQLQKLIHQGEFIQHNRLIVKYLPSDKLGLKVKAIQMAEKRRQH